MVVGDATVAVPAIAHAALSVNPVGRVGLMVHPVGVTTGLQVKVGNVGAMLVNRLSVLVYVATPPIVV